MNIDYHISQWGHAGSGFVASSKAEALEMIKAELAETIEDAEKELQGKEHGSSYYRTYQVNIDITKD